MDFWRWSLLSLFAFMVGGNLPCDRLFDLLSVCAVLPCDLCFLDGKSKRFRLGTRRTSGMVGQQERWYEEIGSSMGMPHTQLGGEFDKNVVIDSFYFGGGRDGGGGGWRIYPNSQTTFLWYYNWWEKSCTICCLLNPMSNGDVLRTNLCRVPSINRRKALAVMYRPATEVFSLCTLLLGRDI